MEILKTAYESYQTIGMLNAFAILYLLAMFNLVMFNIWYGAIHFALACFGAVFYLVGTPLSSLLTLLAMALVTIGTAIYRWRKL